MTADVALVTAAGGRLEILLVRRACPPFEGAWALPGGFMELDETLAECAARELYEETGIRGVNLAPLGVFDRPDRDPRERVVALAYAAAVRKGDTAVKAGSDAGDAQWFALDSLPDLAFDHGEILARLKTWVARHPDPLGLMLAILPVDFTPRELITLYAEITGQKR